MSNYTNLDKFDNFAQGSKLLLPKNCINIQENWLKPEILTLKNYRIDIGDFTLVDPNGNELCLCGFEKYYENEKHTKLIRYFSKPEFKEYHSNTFGNMKYFKLFTNEEYEKLSNGDKFVQFDNLSNNDATDNHDDRNTDSHPNTNIIIKPEQPMKPIVSVEEFFYDDPNTPWKPLPEHDLKQSPCYAIIDIRRYHNYKIPFYYCKLHPDIENAYLESIEHHCKYKEPSVHKSEILRLLSAKEQG